MLGLNRHGEQRKDMFMKIEKRGNDAHVVIVPHFSILEKGKKRIETTS